MVPRLLIYWSRAAGQRIVCRAIAILCAIGLFVTPICEAKCSEPGCASSATLTVQNRDDCHGSAAQSPDDSDVACMRSRHRCSGDEQAVAAVVEVKMTLEPQPRVGIDFVPVGPAIAGNHLLSFSFAPLGVTDRVPLICSRSTVLRI